MKRLKQSMRPRFSERGQSMVEMALMMVILLTILSGVLDLGRGFFSFIAIQNSTGEGALYAAINPRCPDSTSTPAGYNPGYCADPNNVTYRAHYESPNGLVDPQKMTLSVTYADGTSNYNTTINEGDPVTVTLWYHFTMVGPFSGVFPNGQLVFEAHATQKILDLKK